jgi:hypothetical protein
MFAVASDAVWGGDMMLGLEFGFVGLVLVCLMMACIDMLLLLSVSML